jgi:hypothetical protein
MQSEHSRILALLDGGRITLAEAEEMFDTALGKESRIARMKLWLGVRLGYCLAIALIAGALLRPALIAVLHTGTQAIGGNVDLQFFLNRLSEAF